MGLQNGVNRNNLLIKNVPERQGIFPRSPPRVTDNKCSIFLVFQPFTDSFPEFKEIQHNYLVDLTEQIVNITEEN